MNEQNLTERQLREKEYYSQYAKTFDVNQKIDFSPVEGPLFGKERRPWNSYWRTYELPIDYILKKNASESIELLDFGCGPGDNSLRFAKVGFKVTGFDISDENIKNCKLLFEKNPCKHPGNFTVSPAETLPFTNEQFNVVVGIDILHHVDIPLAMKEVDRVLKKGGIAIFREPIEVPVLDNIRNLGIVKLLVPNKPSLEAHITEDERKLNDHDLKVIKAQFPNTTIERSLIFSRADKFVRSKDSKKASFLEIVDFYLMKIFPAWGKLGGAAVIVIRKD